MPNKDHVKKLKKGEIIWNAWRKRNPDIRPDLREAQLQKAELFNVNLNCADLREAAFQHAFLSQATFRHADLRGAQINDARAPFCDFSYARCGGVRFWGTDLRDAVFNHADLTGANLMCTQLVKTKFHYANLTKCKVFGAGIWEVELDGATQNELIISSPSEIDDHKVLTAESLQEAQFIQLLHHEKFRPVLESITRRGILLLGRFREGGLELLRAVADRLRQFGYVPIIFDFPRQEDRNYTETVKTLAGLSRFVIADLSGPSIPQELYATVPHLKIPFVPILEKGRQRHAMAVDLLEYPWVLKPIVKFRDEKHLLGKLEKKIVARAEKQITKRRAVLKKLMK